MLIFPFRMVHIKNEFCIKMGQRRLNMLPLLASESELVKELDFDNSLEEFEEKSKKESLCVVLALLLKSALGSDLLCLNSEIFNL